MFCFGVIKDFVHTVCKENRNNKLFRFFLVCLFFLDTVYSSRETSKICDKFTGKFI